eukprot:TRINITY_DN20671_c0_g1_i1.p1 TRINITY_DN20671_c0_g1~~TRINITY_DN20671_c0_g1_i1.p1  ORF type:complete len:300 (+),score=41.58 TRINITY_DN20671_c0_g1_i1:79-978(+)
MDGLKVLSMQSHVVHGYVGNRCAAFALQLLGIETDVLNTVHFSNHTGYREVGGKANSIDATGLLELIECMERNGLGDGFSHVLTGYIGKVEFLEAVGKVLDKVGDAKFVCDPVLGDEDVGLYVPEGIVPLYKEMIKRADVITPNQYEAKLLSGLEIASLSDARAVCNHFHSIGISTVVITSVVLPSDPATLYVIGSQQPNPPFSISVPRVDLSLTGTGDLTTSLILARSALSPTLEEAIELAVASVQEAIRITKETYDQQKEKGFRDKNHEVASRELQLVKARHAITNPTVVYKAVPIL